MIITQLWKALQAGEALTNSAGWKNRQATTNSLVAILGLLITVLGWTGHKLEVSNEDLMAIAGGIATVLGLCNAALTVVTSKKVGLPSRPGTDANGPDYTQGN